MHLYNVVWCMYRLHRSDKRRQGRTWDVPSHQPLSQALDRHQQASSKPRGFSCRELAALVGATLPQGRFPCHLFCSSLPQSGLRNVSFSSSSIHSIAFFCLLDPALPCHRRAAASLCLPLYYSRLRNITTSFSISPATTTHPSSLDDAPHPTTALLFAISPLPAARTCGLLCCRAGQPERIAIPHLGNPEAAESATGAAPLWTSIAIFFVLSSAVSVHRIRSCHPSSPLSRFLSNRATHRHKKKKKDTKFTVPG